MTTTDDERREIDRFKVGISLLRTGPDGFPLLGQELELDILSRQVLKIDMICKSADTAEKASLFKLADATSRLIAAMISGERDPAIPEAWFKARAELVEPYE
jgi:glycine/D-amino acid oxidase-like deaminating enzyme